MSRNSLLEAGAKSEGDVTACINKQMLQHINEYYKWINIYMNAATDKQ